MKQYLNLCTLYMFLWGLYYLQGTLYPSGSIISQGILAILLLWSLILWGKVAVSGGVPIFMKTINLFLVIMTAYGVLYLLGNEQIYIDGIITAKVGKIEFLKTIYMSLLPIYVFYYYSQAKQLSTGLIRLFSIFWLVIVILSYIRNQQEFQAQLLEYGIYEDVEMTNNRAYDFVHLFPLLLFWNRKPLIQYLLVALLFVFIFSGMKRGAILVGAVCLLWFLYRLYKSATANRRMLIVMLSAAMLIGGAYFVMNLYETSPYFQQRIKQTLEGSSSGRDVIYSSLWEHYQNDPSLIHFILGNGANHTIVVAGKFAHNDWLELLINQGLLGISIYAFYFMVLLYTIYTNRYNKEIYSMLFMIFIIMFASSLFSMSYNNLGLPIAVGIGYCLNKNSINYEKNHLSY